MKCPTKSSRLWSDKRNKRSLSLTKWWNNSRMTELEGLIRTLLRMRNLCHSRIMRQNLKRNRKYHLICRDRSFWSIILRVDLWWMLHNLDRSVILSSQTLILVNKKPRVKVRRIHSWRWELMYLWLKIYNHNWVIKNLHQQCLPLDLKTNMTDASDSEMQSDREDYKVMVTKALSMAPTKAFPFNPSSLSRQTFLAKGQILPSEKRCWLKKLKKEWVALKDKTHWTSNNGRTEVLSFRFKSKKFRTSQQIWTIYSSKSVW